MNRISLWIPFFLALSFLLIGTALFPEIRIWAFSPFLAIAYHRLSFPKSLWLSFFCGLLLDCLSSQFRFGLFSLNFVFVSCFLYFQKKHFFEDKLLSLSLYSILISFLLSFFLILFACLSHEISLNPSLIFSELIVMPFSEGIYAFFWFTCPISLIVYFKKHGLRHLLPQEEDF